MKRAERRQLRQRRKQMSNAPPTLASFMNEPRTRLVFGDTVEEAAAEIDKFWEPVGQVSVEDVAAVLQAANTPECAIPMRVYGDTMLGPVDAIEIMDGADGQVSDVYRRACVVFAQRALDQIDTLGWVFWRMVYDRSLGQVIPVELPPYSTRYVLMHNVIDGRQRLVPHCGERGPDFAALSYVVNMPLVLPITQSARERARAQGVPSSATDLPLLTGRAQGRQAVTLQLTSRVARMLREVNLMRTYYDAAERIAMRMGDGTVFLRQKETEDEEPALAAAVQGAAMRDVFVRAQRMRNGLRVDQNGFAHMEIGGDEAAADGLVVSSERLGTTASAPVLAELRPGLDVVGNGRGMNAAPLAALQDVADITRSVAASIWGLPATIFQNTRTSFGKHAEEMRLSVNEAMGKTARMLEEILQMVVDASFGPLREDGLRAELIEYLTTIEQYRTVEEQIKAMTRSSGEAPQSADDVLRAMFPTADAYADWVDEHMVRVRVRYTTMLTIDEIITLARVGSLPVGAAHRLILAARHLDPDQIEALDALEGVSESPSELGARRKRALGAEAIDDAPPAKRQRTE